MHQLLKIFSLLVACLTLVPGLSRAEVKTIRVAHGFPVSHSVNLSLLHFEQKLAFDSEGRIKVEVIPEARMGQDDSLLEQVATGMLSMAVVDLKILAGTAPGFSLVRLPFIFPDRRTLYSFLDSPFKRQLESDDLRRKAMVLGWFDGQPRVWFSTRKPFTKPWDFYSITMNVPDDPISLETASVLKAKASAIPLQGSALLDGLTRGQFDVADALLDEAVFGQGATVEAYLTLSCHEWELSVLIVDPAFWSNLTSSEQQLLLNAAFEAERVNRGYVLSQQIALLEKARSKGIKIVSLDETDRRSFAREVSPVSEKWQTVVGPVLFDEFMKRVQEGQDFP